METTCELVALEFDKIEGIDAPQHVRTVLFESDSKDGIYMPAAVLGDEQAIYLAAMFDGVATCIHLGHVFVPASWIEREYPSEDTDIALNVCVESVRSYMRSESCQK